MPQEDESFLDAVLREPGEDIPAPRPAESKRSPWPSSPEGDAAEGENPGEAYKPDLVGPRIRNALKGGHGLSGSPKRYAMLVAAMVGLASLPTWAILHTGLSDAAPVLAAPADIFLADPPKVPSVIVRGQIHAEPPTHVSRASVPKVRAHVAAPLRIRPTERFKPVTLPAERPVARPAPVKHHKAKKPAKQTRSHSSSRSVVIRPVVVVVPSFPPLRRLQHHRVFPVPHVEFPGMVPVHLWKHHRPGCTR